jgi:ABC-type transport system involved in multi-copper enzyme maturation permease subunit
MSRIVALALNTFREAIRNRVLYVLLMFGVALIASALALGQVSLHEEARVSRDVGLAGIALFGAIIGIFIGVNLVYKEIDKKTVFALVPKPIDRWELILGKYIGIVLTLAVLVAIMSAMLFTVLALQNLVAGATNDVAPVVRAIALLFGQQLVIVAVAVLFSSFTTPILSGLFTLGIVLVGLSTPELRELIARVASAPARALLSALLRLFPDLHLFYVSGGLVDGQRVSVHGAYVDWSYVAVASGYGLAYTACALALAMLIFSRRDFV